MFFNYVGLCNTPGFSSEEIWRAFQYQTPTSYGAEFMQTINELRVVDPDSAFIPLDKDNKRRCEMHYLGYLYRLWENFGPNGAPFYSCTQLSRSQAVAVKQRLIDKYIPKSSHPACVLEELLPKAYQTYKGKCLHQVRGSTGLSCEKAHAHEREITNNKMEPCANFLSLGARALRLAWKLSEKQIWTCWNQSKIAYETYRRLLNLRSHIDYPQNCPCGNLRQHSISIIRIDAAQFFKSASVERGVQRVRSFLYRLEQKQGVKAVAVKKGKKASGFLVKKNHRHSKHESRLVPFCDIVSGISYASKDKLFCVGDTVFSRNRGWPMGGSYSEPSTLLDLGTDVHKFYTDTSFRRKIG